MNNTPYDPEGAIVAWDVVNGTRVDRILVVNTEHPTIQRRIVMVRNYLVIEQCENLHSHSFWHEMPRDRAAQMQEGEQYVLVGHTVYDIEPAKNIHRHWAAVHDFAEHRFGFRSAPTMVQARDLVDTDVMVCSVERAYASSLSRRVRHKDLCPKQEEAS